MAITQPKVFSNCFDQVQNACVAVQNGNAKKAAAIITSLKNDAKTLQRESRRCYESLERYSAEKECEMEIMTSQINDLYHQERDLEKQKRDLNTKIQALESRKSSEYSSLSEARTRYDRAERDREDAQEEYDRFKTFWWVPIYGQILLVRELIEDYSGQARSAGNDMRDYQDRCDEAEREIADLKHEITVAEMWISAKEYNIKTLKQERTVLHQQLGDSKETAVFILEATNFWEEISSLSDNASLKTDRVEKILSFAAKKNQVKILRSNGTKTLVGSFKECWMEIEDMIRSNDLVFAVENLSLGY